MLPSWNIFWLRHGVACLIRVGCHLVWEFMRRGTRPQPHLKLPLLASIGVETGFLSDMWDSAMYLEYEYLLGSQYGDAIVTHLQTMSRQGWDTGGGLLLRYQDTLNPAAWIELE